MQYVPRYRRSYKEKEKMKHLENITREQIEQAIDNCIVLQSHAERNRKILKRRLIDGITYEQLAEEFDLSTQSIQKIIYRNEQKIFSYIK